MTIKNIEILKKQILYRSSYTGTKETDLLYKKFIANKINNFTHKELVQLSSLFNEISDADILLILTSLTPCFDTCIILIIVVEF